MADFCWDCWRDLFGTAPERNDFRGLCEPGEVVAVKLIAPDEACTELGGVVAYAAETHGQGDGGGSSAPEPCPCTADGRCTKPARWSVLTLDTEHTMCDQHALEAKNWPLTMAVERLLTFSDADQIDAQGQGEAPA